MLCDVKVHFICFTSWIVGAIGLIIRGVGSFVRIVVVVGFGFNLNARRSLCSSIVRIYRFEISKIGFIHFNWLINHYSQNFMIIMKISPTFSYPKPY